MLNISYILVVFGWVGNFLLMTKTTKPQSEKSVWGFVLGGTVRTSEYQKRRDVACNVSTIHLNRLTPLFYNLCTMVKNQSRKADVSFDFGS